MEPRRDESTSLLALSVTATDRLWRERARGSYLEGLAIDPMTGEIWVSDVMAGGVRSDQCPERVLVPERQWIGGLLSNSASTLLVSGGGGIRWLNHRSGESDWLLRCEDVCALEGTNEMAADERGGLYFGSSDVERIIAGEKSRPTALYYRQPDGRVRCVSESVAFANGMAIDKQRQKLYCNDTFRGTWSFDIGIEGSLSEGRLLFSEPFVDGLALDEGGTLWISRMGNGAITRINAEGLLMQGFETGAGGVTQLRFFGVDGAQVAMTAVEPESARVLKRRGALNEGGSRLLTGPSGVRGCVLNYSEIDLKTAI